MNINQKMDIASLMIGDGRLSVDWVIKNVLGFDKKSDYRKLKISRVFKNG
jgi:hypothetical protein